MLTRRTLLLAAMAAPLVARAVAAPPPLMLAEPHRDGMPLDDFWVSEKYDGVRVYWDGKQLLTRVGERIAAPAWFTALLPKLALDGELWAGRGRFSHVVATLRAAQINDTAWHELRFMVFDLPAQAGDFTARLAVLRKILPITDAPWVVPVPQQRAGSPQELQALLDKTVKMGGEGLMLHRGAAPYHAGRSPDLRKYKPYDDDDARVVEVQMTKPRDRRPAQRMTLVVETPEGKRFKLATHVADIGSAVLPAAGSWISYRYDGLAPDGMPRAPRFLRVREDLAPLH